MAFNMQTRPSYALLRHELYIACEQFDFDWTVWAVGRFDAFWADGMNLGEISETMQRNEIEVFMLYLDRVYKGKIKPDMKRIFYK
jgi:hypothetical protein